MKNNYLYYTLILIPFVIVCLLLYKGYTTLFIWGLLFYALIYRPITDSYRLVARGNIARSDMWRIFVPIYSLKWHWFCYFKK